MAADLRAEFAIDAELIEGANGIFDVTVDGERVFSKHAVGRFPTSGEILDRLRA